MMFQRNILHPSSGLKMKQSKKPASSRQQAYLVSCLSYSSCLKMEVVWSSETSDDFYRLHGVTSLKTVLFSVMLWEPISTRYRVWLNFLGIILEFCTVVTLLLIKNASFMLLFLSVQCLGKMNDRIEVQFLTGQKVFFSLSFPGWFFSSGWLCGPPHSGWIPRQ
jgi:hypothetical protein